MKCGACGYEKRYKIYHTQKVHLFKSGKRKGKIKQIEDVEIMPFEDDPEFTEIELKAEPVINFATRDEYARPYSIRLYACPRCNTVQIQDDLAW